MTREEHLQFCRICLNQKLDLEQGLICRLSGKLADFDDRCEYFQADEQMQQQQEKNAANNALSEAMATRKVRLSNALLDYVGLMIFSVTVGLLLGLFLSFFPSPTISFPDQLGTGGHYLIGLMAGIVYFLLFEATTGRTPGKFVTGTRVLMKDGSLPRFRNLLIRSLCRFIPLEPFSFLGAEPRGWHDRLSGTIVVSTSAFPFVIKQKDSFPGPWQSLAITGLLLLLMVAFGPIMLFSVFMPEDLTFFLYYSAAVGVTFLIAHHWRKKTSKISHYPFALSTLSLIPLIAVATIALHLGVIAPVISRISVPESMQGVMSNDISQLGLFTFITMVLVAPVLEEMLFRGIILEGLSKRISPVQAILLSSLLFALIHLNPWQFVSAFILSLFIGWVYMNTRNLLLAVGIHFFNNLLVVSAGILYGSGSPGQTFSLIQVLGHILQEFLLVIIAMTILILTVVYLHHRFRELRCLQEQENDLAQIPSVTAGQA